MSIILSKSNEMETDSDKQVRLTEFQELLRHLYDKKDKLQQQGIDPSELIKAMEREITKISIQLGLMPDRMEE